MGSGEKLDSGFVLFPGGHAANKTVDLHEVMTAQIQTAWQNGHGQE